MPRGSEFLWRRGTAAAWVTANPTLDAGEVGYETDSRRVKVGDGATAWVSLGYADAPPLPYTAPPGTASWQLPNGVASIVNAAPVSGQLSLMPLDVGPRPTAFNALGLGVAVGQVGGTTTTTLAVYPDNGSGGLPNLVGGPIVSTTVVLTGAFAATLGTVAWTPAPGRYWVGFLYVASVAPGTSATVNTVATGGAALWNSSPGGITKSLTATGLTAMPTTQITLAAGGSNPCVSARAA